RKRHCEPDRSVVRFLHNAECLNETLFSTLREARQIIEAWRIDYNQERPHTSLNGLTPNEFARRSSQDHNQNGVYL
ncbi:MAG TPA: transposase, partial [Hyphomicrobium sp.]|nr:transposase [Hyphomicrobium sp.]